ncbi:MAG: cation transporter [Gemmatimonadaceae bacterium]
MSLLTHFHASVVAAMSSRMEFGRLSLGAMSGGLHTGLSLQISATVNLPCQFQAISLAKTQHQHLDRLSITQRIARSNRTLVGWNVRWRARSALVLEYFLGALGVGVVGATIYGIFVRQHPEAELMGLFGGIALAVNALAELILIPHRAGDANGCAVWLFSRNDAIGNLAVVIAAALVRWTGTPWPDLVVALVIATLFLHSAWAIIEDARTDLASV